MVLDLRSIRSVIVNLPQDTHRRAHMTEMLSELGMPHEFVPGVTKFGKKKNVAGAYAAGFDKMETAPFIIFDDDQELLWEDCVLPHVPEDADIIYLATRNSGCLPDNPEIKAQYGLNAYDGLALAEAYDDTYVRLYSMISSMAILILSEKGRERYRLELLKSFNRSAAADVRYAFAMPHLNVYGLRKPMFAEKLSLQTEAKADDQREALTHTPLRLVEENEIRVARHRLRKLTVQAKRDEETKALNWHVLEAVGPKDVLSPISLPAPDIAGYNQDILGDRVEIIEGAKVFPPDDKLGSCGVTDELGKFCPYSTEFRWVKRRLDPPSPERHQEEFQRLEGTYLYGGWLHPHFGHFLTESTTRLWALDEDFGPINGIIFIPYAPKSIWRARRSYLPIFDILAGDIPIIPQVNPAFVERLIVPEPGFGHQARMLGSPKYIDFIRNRVANKVASAGPSRLYVSRTQLNPRRGGVFGEALLEEYLSQNGYEIFHPQQHSPEEQLARYRAADYLISLDGSPLHFAAFALKSSARVAIIKRRASDIQDQMAEHIRRFSGATATVIDAIEEMWVYEGPNRIDYSSFGQLDMVKVSTELVESGFVTTTAPMDPLGENQIREELEQRPTGPAKMIPYSRI